MRIHRMLAPALLAVAALTLAACSGEAPAEEEVATAPVEAPAEENLPPAGGPPAGTPTEIVTAGLGVGSIVLADGSEVQALVDDSGKAVYALTDDSADDPKCTDPACIGFWPPVVSAGGELMLADGITAAVILWDNNGVQQLTVGGFPLYAFGGDTGPGEAQGHGLNSNFSDGKWTIVAPDGTLIAK